MVKLNLKITSEQNFFLAVLILLPKMKYKMKTLGLFKF